MSIPENDGSHKRKARFLSPSSNPTTFKFWSDSNLQNFVRDMQDLGVRFEFNGKGELLVYDDSREVRTIALDYGADTF